jgi:hypothetical protein
MATVVANGSKTNELYGAVPPPLHFGVRGAEVALRRPWGTDRNQNVIFADHTDTPISTERSWLLIPGTTGDRLAPGSRRGPLSRRIQYHRCPNRRQASGQVPYRVSGNDASGFEILLAVEFSLALPAGDAHFNFSLISGFVSFGRPYSDVFSITRGAS